MAGCDLNKIGKSMRNCTYMFLASLLAILPRTAISQPNLEVTTSVLYPQLRTFDTESTYWRSMLNYNQSFSSFKLSARMDYGSETNRYVNPFRVYEFNLNWDHHPFSLTFGRFNYWSSISNVRVDGIQAEIFTKKYGKFEVIGGFKSVIDFSDTTYVQSDFISEELYINKTLLHSSWSIQKYNQFINVSYWAEGENDTLRPHVGITSNWRVLGINIHENIAIDLENNELNFARVFISKHLNNHRLNFGLHQIRLNGINPWPWVKNLEIPITFSAGWTWKINPQLQWLQKINVRQSSYGTVFYNSQFFYKQYYVAFIAGQRDNQLVYGGTLGVTKHVGNTMSFGSNLSLNIFDYNDIIEPINASSVYSWLDWNLKEKLNIKFFGRYSVNAYYKKDGRAGAVIYVKI